MTNGNAFYRITNSSNSAGWDRLLIADHQKRFAASEETRTAYSPRHTYICLCLMEGADTHLIAKNCGTSVEMIENLRFASPQPAGYDSDQCT